MKRIMILCLSLMLLAACQPTPEQEIVFNKGDGTIEDVIESKPVMDYAIQSPSAGAEQSAAEEPADEQPEAAVNTLADAIGAPDRCTDAFENKVYGGTLKVEIDADVEIPNVSKVPVYTVHVKTFTPEERERITKLLLGDGPYWNFNRALADRTMWKRTIEEQTQRLDEIDSRAYGEDFDYESMRFVTESNLNQYLKGYAELPEPGPSEPWTGSFSADRTVVSDEENRCLAISRDEIFFYDEAQSEPMMFGGRAPENAEEERAVQAAEALFAELAGAQYRATGITYDDDSFQKRYGLAQETDPHKAYSVKLVRMVDGIPCYPYSAFHGSDTAQQAAGFSQDYDSPMIPEHCDVLVQNGKVAAIQWYNAFAVAGTENENVALLPFDDVLNVFRQQIFRLIYLDSAEGVEPESVEQMVVTRICLSYMKVKKKDAPNEQYLLPVWDFMEYTYNPQYSHTEADLIGTKEWFSGQSLLTISAVDGSIIDRNAGY